MSLQLTRHIHPGLHKRDRHQQDQDRDTSPLFNTSGVIYPDLCSPRRKAFLCAKTSQVEVIRIVTVGTHSIIRRWEISPQPCLRILVTVYNYLIRGHREDGVRLFSELPCDRESVNKHKVEYGTDIRKISAFFPFFLMRIVVFWTRLPRETVGYLCLEKLKIWLYMALSNLIWPELLWVVDCSSWLVKIRSNLFFPIFTMHIKSGKTLGTFCLNL